MRDVTQAGGRPAQAAAPSAAEMARVDAQLELAAKKAALAGMERAAAQGADVAPAAPAAPAAPSEGQIGVITIQQGDRTITLTNPTPDQLAQIGTAGSSEPPVSGWQLVALTSAVVWGGVVIVAMYLWHRRRTRGIAADPKASETAARMARIENAVESIAVEVERISEGQRYTSRMLSEGAAEQVKVNVDVPEILGAVLQNRGQR